MSRADEVEEIIKNKNKTAPRISLEDVESVIVSETYTILPSGKCMVCELTTTNGHTVRGEASCVSIENFDDSIGRIISRDNARDKVFALEGYLLQQRLFENSK